MLLFLLNSAKKKIAGLIFLNSKCKYLEELASKNKMPSFKANALEERTKQLVNITITIFKRFSKEIRLS